ncbi:MAG TPA: hypothetical protein DDW49_05195 [Deltaproteobacteria bacterium]|nr:MAG: hypothetical protein A2048_04445 [Deltaproteobacteria bacterium GWA2_45_12]HBF12772.1 hypothetical protein [Deltaproteobacteria bacterium]
MKSPGILDQPISPLPPRPTLESPRLGQFYKKKGVYDGKLLHSASKVTYTFVGDNEVISLHFDRDRKAIFYKGHNIENIELSNIQQAHLEKFRQALIKNPGTKDMIGDFDLSHQAYLKKSLR